MEQVIAVLKALHLLEDYISAFFAKRIDDTFVEKHIRDDSIDETLTDVITDAEHRSRFISEFRRVTMSILDDHSNLEKLQHCDGRKKLTARSSDVSTLNGTLTGIPDYFEPPDGPEPTQIMKFAAHTSGALKIVCNEKKLKFILEKTENRPVVVLVVAGPTRKGKSFFLNFILRRLIGLRDGKEDWMGWTEMSEPLVGFTWKANDVCVTDGIWIWSEPFTLTSKHDGSEFDLLLVDTQGVFDDQTGKREWSILMGLSLLTSSCLVYNTMHNIDENDLQLLDEFLSFGEMALQDTNNAGKQKPFQNLLFLLRDWGNPSQYPYGSEGGHTFIQNKLQRQGHHQKENSDVRDKLEKCFNGISCILLPHPGPEVIKAEYDGSIGSCVTFASAIESAIEDILFKGNLPLKTINGNTLTGKELFDLFKTYVELFNDDRLLTSESMYYAACKVCNAAVVSKCVTGFIDEFRKILEDAPVASDADLKENLKEEKERALRVFESCRKMGSRRIINEADDYLCSEIMAEFKKLKLNYMLRREQNISKASNMAVLQYQNSMENNVKGKNFLSEDNLEQNSQYAQTEALDLFYSQLKLKKNDEVFSNERAHILELMQKLFLEFKTLNSTKKAEAEEIIYTDVTNLSRLYAEKLNLKIKGRILLDEELAKYHNRIASSLTADLQKKHGASPLLTEALDRLAVEINEKLESVRTKFESTLKEHFARAQKLSSKSLAYYIKRMTEENANELDANEFNTSHAVANTAAVKILTEFHKTLPQEIMLETLTALHSKISDAYVKLLSSFNEKVSKIQADISAATKAAKKQYKASMTLITGDHYVLADSYLESQHQEAHRVALTSIEQAIKDTQQTFKGEVKNKIVRDYSDAINKWFVSLRDANSIKMREAEKKIKDEVQNGITQYQVEKDTSINEVDVTDIDVDDFLDPIVEKIEQEFNDACHSNPLYSQGKQELVKILKADREKTKQEIEDAKVIFHKNSTAVVALAHQNYHVKMSEIDVNANYAEFKEFHDQQLSHSIEVLQKSKSLIKSKWIDKYEEDLKSVINESFTELFTKFKQSKNDLAAAIANVKEKALEKYTIGMDTYFQESPEPFSKLELLTQHNQEKGVAKSQYLQQYPSSKPKSNVCVVELGQEINLLFQNFEIKNKSRIHQMKQVLESTVLPHVQDLFTNLEGRLLSDPELPQYQQHIITKCTDHLLSSTASRSSSNTIQLKQGIIKQIVTEQIKQLQEVHNSVQVTNQQQQEIIAEASSRYRNKMIHIIISNSKNDTFEKSHTSVLKSELEKIQNSAAITCPLSVQNIIAKVKSNIEDIYNEMSARKNECLTKILEAQERAVCIYLKGLSGYIKSHGYVEDSEIIAKHNIYKNKATNHFKNDLEKINFYSKTVDWIKSGDVPELETRLGQLLTQTQDTNNANKQAAEQRMEAGVKSIMDDYIVDMNLKLNGATLTVEQVQYCHNKISKKSLEKFARINSKSPLFPKWNDVLQKNLQTKLHANRQTISDTEDQTNRVGEALILDGINYYQESMREAIEQDEDSFKKTHLLIKKFPVELLKNTGKISNKDQLAVFVGKLEIQIQNAYKEFSSNISQNRIKIKDVIESVKQQCFEQYGNNMRKSFSSQNGQTDDAKLQTQHSEELSAAQTKLNQCYNGIQTSSRTFKDQQIPDVKNLTESIDTLFEQLKKENSESITQSQNLLHKHIESSKQKYVEGMTLKLNGEFVLEEKFETLHTSVAHPLLENFTLVWSASFLFKEGQECLLNEINSLKTKLKDEMTVAHNALHEDLQSTVQSSVKKYKEEMNKILLEDDQVFSQGHQTHQKQAMETLEKLRNRETEKYIYKYESDLQKEVLEAQLKLLIDHHRCKMEFGASLVQAKENAKKNYEAQMNLFFDSIKTYISPTLLEEQHVIKSAEAIVILQDQYKNHRGTPLHDQEENDFLELNESIQNHYDKFQVINNKRLQKEQRKYLGVIKENYKQSVKILVETETAEDEFVRQNKGVVESCENKLQAELKSKHATTEFTSELVDDLKRYIGDQFKDYMAFFQSRMAQDKAAVTSAIIEARQYYNEEMSKRVQTRDWFEPEELSKINTEVIDLSIAKCENVKLTPSQGEQLRHAMAVVYQKYSEDNTLKYPVENPAIGIDLGTTYSCVGVYLNGEVKIIPNKDVSDGTTIPSYVAFNRDHTIDVGNIAKEQAFLYPQNTIFDAKRLIGRSFSDPIVQEDIKLWPFSVIDDNDRPKIQVCDKQFRPEEISAKILIKIKTMAQSYLNKNVKEAVVTVPAYFNNAQRQATRDAAEIAGLKVKILNEPTAAAIAYKLHRTDELKRNVLVFDLGGGTFDVAVLEIKGKDIVVKATGGDTHLGGEDFDSNIVNHIIERVKNKFNRDLTRGRDSTDSQKTSNASGRLRRLRDRCEGAKRNLSSALATTIAIDSLDGNFDLEETITREEFEALNINLFKKCIDVVGQTLVDAKINKTEIDDIVLVGGSTRIPKVQELLKLFFDNKKELNGTINPDEAVARGAAIQAALLHGEQATRLRDSVALVDVTPFSLGTSAMGGKMEVIIPKNSTFPCKHSMLFETTSKNQKNVGISVYEGENSVAELNNCLGSFILRGIPRGPKGSQVLDYTMIIDDEGILHMKAVCVSNSIRKEITIESYNGRMTKKEIKNAQALAPFRW